MVPLGLRVWDGEKISYPTTISAKFNIPNKTCNVTTTIEKKEFEAKTVMLLTSGEAINGPIYEGDVLEFESGETGVVEFDEDAGAFVAGETVVCKQMPLCQIIGNRFETPQLVGKKSSSGKKVKVTVAPSQGNTADKEDSAPIPPAPVKETPVAAPTASKDEAKAAPTTDEKSNKLVLPEKNVSEEAPPEEIFDDVSEDSDEKNGDIFAAARRKKPEEDDDDVVIETSDQLEAEAKIRAKEAEEAARRAEEARLAALPEVYEKHLNIHVEVYYPNEDAFAGGAYCFALHTRAKDPIFKSDYISDTNLISLQISAMMDAIQATDERTDLDIYTTCSYIVDPIEAGRLEQWAQSGWLKADGKPLKNSALWKALHALCSGRNIKWHTVPEGKYKLNQNCLNNAIDEYGRQN